MSTAKRSDKVTFIGARGDSLAARLDRPDGEPRAFALFAHCFTCSKDIFAASRIARALTDHGYAVLRFDFTGLGSSEGEFANTNFTSNVEDLVAAADFLRGAHQAPKLLIGHSLGGAAVLAAAGEVDEAEAVVTIGAPADPAHVLEHFTGSVEDIEKMGEAEVEVGGRPFTIRRQFLEDIEGHRLGEKIGDLRKALLIFHSPQDQIVGIDNAARIFKAAKHPKSFISLDGADHLLSRREDATYVADVIAALTSRYLGTTQPRTEGPDIDAGPKGVVVTEVGEGKFAQIVSVNGKHVMRADEPATMGGNDTGPSPYDYVLGGLGACTSMTIRMYAERKKWPLDKVTVTLRHEKVHAEDCKTCEAEAGSKIDYIERDVKLDGDLSAAQREKLIEIAEKCPVHRTLHSHVEVATREKS